MKPVHNAQRILGNSMIAETYFLAEIKYRIGAQMFRDHGLRNRNCCGGGAQRGVAARNVPDAGFCRAIDGATAGGWPRPK
jgi:hypothetical protein